MDAALRDLVWRRAKYCCEYCRLPQAAASFFRFHIEHIRARQHGGIDDAANLALACPDCNRHKGPNLTSVDSDTDEVVPLFNPRLQGWEEHFAMQGPLIVGITATGRVTVQLLRMNDDERVVLREALQAAGEL